MFLSFHLFTAERCLQLLQQRAEHNEVAPKSVVWRKLCENKQSWRYVVAGWKRQRGGKPQRFYTKAVFNPRSLGKGSISFVCVSVCVCVCQQDQDQVTQSDLTQPGLIKAALRPGGPETQHCFCCPTQGVFPLEGERGGRRRGVLLIREKETVPWLGHTLFHSLLVEIKPLLYFYVCFLQLLGPSFFFFFSLLPCCFATVRSFTY